MEKSKKATARSINRDLVKAIDNDDLQAFERAIASGANVNTCKGKALWCAITGENKKISLRLLELGADPDLLLARLWDEDVPVIEKAARRLKLNVILENIREHWPWLCGIKTRPVYDIDEVLSKAVDDDVLSKLTEHFDPQKQSLTELELSQYLIWEFDWDVACDGVEAGFQRLNSGDLRLLHKGFSLIGAIKSCRLVERAVKILAPNLPKTRYETFVLREQTTESTRAKLEGLWHDFYEAQSSHSELAFEFITKHKHLFGGSKTNRLKPASSQS